MYRKILVCFCRNRNYSTSSQNCRCHFVFLNSIYSHIWGNDDFLKLLYFADVKSSVSFFFRVDEWIIKSCIKPLQKQISFIGKKYIFYPCFDYCVQFFCELISQKSLHLSQSCQSIKQLKVVVNRAVFI